MIDRSSLISVYFIFTLVTAGFIGILVFEGVVDEGGVEAGTIIVDKSGGGDYTTIQAAIDAASSGDTICVWSGSYSERIVINKAINLIGNSSSNTTINGGYTLDVITVTSDWVNITGFEIINCGSSGFPNFDSGIELYNINNTHIYKNEIMNCTLGINIVNSDQNIIENNYIKPITGWRENILMTNSDYNKISNNSLFNNWYGIRFTQSEHNIVDNNHFEQNKYGIYASLSNNNHITNNAFLNNTDGIFTQSSAFNSIKNNSIFNGYNNGIYLYNSNNEILSNNTMISCGLNIFTYEISKWNTYKIDTNNKVNGKPIYLLKHADGINIPEDQGQLILVNCSNIVIENQNYSQATIGILIFFSSNITINNNTCSSNGLYGINIWNSTFINIQNNTCNSNKRIGIYAWEISYSTISYNECLDHKDSTALGGVGISFMGANTIRVSNNNCSLNKIEGIAARRINSSIINNNFCYSNDKFGIGLYYSGTNIIENNICNSNLYDGIYMKDSNIENIIANNTCNSHLYNGIYVEGSTSNIITNNTCRNNTRSGLYIALSESNIIQNNTFNNNINSGFKMYTASNNVIKNNSISSNDEHGVYFIGDTNNYVEENTFKQNNISNNKHGFYLDFAKNNYIDENMVSFNSVTGLWISSSSTNNLFYYNNILSNTQQAVDLGTNSWNNIQSEGNYWSDYTGLDDGSGTGKHATAGDGIGDTMLPHHDDNYPFVFRDGWRLPTIPVLSSSETLNRNGSYQLYWNHTSRTTGYVLEEDDSALFTSPDIVYSGPANNRPIENMDNGTRYYRLKAYNDITVSDWSNVIYVTVDIPPNSPSGLYVKSIGGNEVTLQWLPNNESDLQGYRIYKNATGAGSSGPFDIINSVSSIITEYTITGLASETTYHFAVSAFDTISTDTELSDVVSAITLDITPPKFNIIPVAIAINNHEIKISWKASIDPDLEGYLIFMNETGSGKYGNYNLINKTEDWVGSYTVTNLTEQTMYHFKLKAFDEVPNNSTFSEVASATTPDLIPPAEPTGLIITNETSTSLTLEWLPNTDHDLIGYFLFRGDSETDFFEQLNPTAITVTQYTDTDLFEDTEYFYKLKAVDDADLRSDYSSMVKYRSHHLSIERDSGFYTET
jgi:parallel beta-helix repeat protein